jgi:hypothetical protein
MSGSSVRCRTYGESLAHAEGALSDRQYFGRLSTRTYLKTTARDIVCGGGARNPHSPVSIPQLTKVPQVLSDQVLDPILPLQPSIDGKHVGLEQYASQSIRDLRRLATWDKCPRKRRNLQTPTINSPGTP